MWPRLRLLRRFTMCRPAPVWGSPGYPVLTIRSAQVTDGGRDTGLDPLTPEPYGLDRVTPDVVTITAIGAGGSGR